MFKKIHSNCPAAGINDPVLTYTQSYNQRKNKLYVFMQKIRNSIREKMFLSIIFESYGTYEQKIYWNVPFPKTRGHIDKKFIEMSHLRKVTGHMNKKFSVMSCFWKVMGHRKQERLHMSQRGKSQGHRRKEKSYMSQRGQREGYRKQEKLHISPKCHHNFYCMTSDEKNYRLTREYLTNTL